MSDCLLTAIVLRESLSRFRFRFTTEDELQVGLEVAMWQLGLSWEREKKLRVGRIDFLVDPGIGLEVKVDGSRAALVRQIHAYLGEPDVRELLIVTSKSHHADIPGLVRGKPVRVLCLSAGLL